MPRLPKTLISLLKAAVQAANRLTSTRPAPAPVIADTEPAAASALQPTTHTRVGKYDQALAELVKTGPALTAAQAAERLGVHPTALYPVIRRLEANRQIVKDGRLLHPPIPTGTEQLWCEEGHTWTRSTTRGRKPRRCPKHR